MSFVNGVFNKNLLELINDSIEFSLEIRINFNFTDNRCSIQTDLEWKGEKIVPSVFFFGSVTTFSVES